MPPRSTSETMARLPPGPELAALGVGPLAALLGRPALLDGAEVRLVGLDDPALAAHRAAKLAVAHCLAKPMRQKPCALVGDAEGAVELVGREALLGRRHEVET